MKRSRLFFSFSQEASLSFTNEETTATTPSSSSSFVLQKTMTTRHRHTSMSLLRHRQQLPTSTLQYWYHTTAISIVLLLLLSISTPSIVTIQVVSGHGYLETPRSRNLVARKFYILFIYSNSIGNKIMLCYCCGYLLWYNSHALSRSLSSYTVIIICTWCRSR